MHASSGSNFWQQIIQECLVALSIKNNQWNVATVNVPVNVLRSDVVQQCCLTRTRLADDYGLHPAGLVRPVPWLAVYVVAGHDCIFLQGFSHIFTIPELRDEHRRMRPGVLNPLSPIS